MPASDCENNTCGGGNAAAGDSKPSTNKKKPA
jgi:hypothetical protein